MGTLRDKAKWPDDILNGYGVRGVCMDFPQWPARVLVDDIEQKIIENIGYGYGADMWSYIISPYPDSHHVHDPIHDALMKLFGRVDKLQWDRNMKGGGKWKSDSDILQ